MKEQETKNILSILPSTVILKTLHLSIQHHTLIPQLDLLQEREFFKLAGFMLLARFQVMNAQVCTKHKGHAKTKHGLIFQQLSFVGYNDTAKEMQLILQEANPQP